MTRRRMNVLLAHECIFRIHFPYHKWWNVHPLFQNTYPLSQVIECIPPISEYITSGGMYTPYFRTHTSYHKWWNVYALFPPITFDRMYTPYFSAHSPSLRTHVAYFEKCGPEFRLYLFQNTQFCHIQCRV